MSCRCGKITLSKEDGYITSDIVDAAYLGQLAEEGCRRKRLRKWLSFALVTVVVASILCGVVGWQAGRHEDRKKEAVLLLNRSFIYYQNCDYKMALRNAEAALKLDPSNPHAAEAVKIIEDVSGMDRRGSIPRSQD